MNKLLIGLSLLALSATANADFFGGNNGEWKMGPQGPYYEESDWPEWTPMYWMEEMMDSFDEEDNGNDGFMGGMPFMGGNNNNFGGMPFMGNNNNGYPAMPYGAPMMAPMPYAPQPMMAPPMMAPMPVPAVPMAPAPAAAAPGPATTAPAAN
ncbi:MULTISPECIES: hypothetical protein [Thiothrix]|jgi:hypothetical protein|uniref:hypothetical protein n=1 Tax=Thiothrix TaxID=1030 RepID=UPI00257AD9FA|nr:MULTISPECIES: hypothetical protein [Thiothrix]MDX9988475.1 hypothetical protein [Thiothrix unzii]